jgi:hypothetical protein
MNAPLPAFQQFQMAFGRRCRNPRAARPAGVPARRMAVYEELLFNNVTGFLDACFPVCRAMLGEARWRRLNRAFFRDWRSHTPLFREIPHEFLRFLEGCRLPLPAWLRQLAHYEWVELAVDTSTASTLLNLRYDWPVHRIGPGWRPRKPEATYLLVFRDQEDIVRFVEANAVTARLVELLTAHDCSGAEAVERLASEVDEKSAMAVRLHGPALLDDLRRQGAITGART